MEILYGIVLLGLLVRSIQVGWWQMVKEVVNMFGI